MMAQDQTHQHEQTAATLCAISGMMPSSSVSLLSWFLKQETLHRLIRQLPPWRRPSFRCPTHCRQQREERR